MKGESPTRRTLKKLRSDGWTADVTEHWNSFAPPRGKRVDLFGFCDVLAIKEDEGTLAVQCTTFSNMSSRLKKLTDPKLEIEITPGKFIPNPVPERVLLWLNCYNRAEIWGWRQKKNSRLYEVVIRPVTLLDF